MIKQWILVSLIIHAVILFIKIDKPTPKKPQLKQNKKIEVVLKKKKNSNGGKNEDIFIIKKILEAFEQMQKLSKREAQIKSLLRECKTHYRGIGVIHDSLFSEISFVVPGGPADQAGIKIGDIPIDSLDIRDKYPVGTQITVSIMRNGIIHHIPVTIGKICTEKKNDNKRP